MKHCPYCGKEYPDEVTHCLLDNYLLVGEEPPVIAKTAEPPPLPLELPPPLPASGWGLPRLNERQMQIFEVILVCVIAVASGVLTSLHALVTHTYRTTANGPSSATTWAVQDVRLAACIGLLWYVLQRRQKTFSYLGLAWSWVNVGWSVVVFVGGWLAFNLVYRALMFFQWPADSHPPVSYLLFGGGLSLFVFLGQFINPFFEELIVRGYLMTEVRQLTGSPGKAIFISVALQTSYHFYQGTPQALSHAATFLIYAVFYAATGRLAPVILAHLYSDLYSSLLYWYHHQTY